MKSRTKYLNKNPDRFIESLITTRQSFTLKLTNYSTEINWNGETYFCADTANGPNLFKATGLIKNDITKSNIIIDEVPQSSIKYFGINSFIHAGTKIDEAEVYNVDIKSAYPRCLLNNSLIGPETFKFVHEQLNKADRLKSIGMLATEKIIYTFEQGEETAAELKKNVFFRNYFMFICHHIGEIMQRITTETQNDFLFFWVDGIYLRTPEAAKIAAQVLDDFKYPFSTETLTNFTAGVNNDICRIKFTKNNIEKNFSIPLRNGIKKRIVTYLQNQKLRA